MLLNLASTHPIALASQAAFEIFFVENHKLPFNLRLRAWHAIINCVEKASDGHGLTEFVSKRIRASWARTIANPTDAEPQKLRCTILCIAVMIDESSAAQLAILFGDISSVVPILDQWFMAIQFTLSTENILTILDYKYVIDRIARAVKNDLQLGKILIESGLIKVLKNLPLGPDLTLAISVKSATLSLKCCWSLLTPESDWTGEKQVAEAVAKECEEMVIDSSRFD